ncbi:MAG: hypothetical protein ACRDRR_05960 [Pseudonocardiaceae bacterium]
MFGDDDVAAAMIDRVTHHALCGVRGWDDIGRRSAARGRPAARAPQRRFSRTRRSLPAVLAGEPGAPFLLTLAVGGLPNCVLTGESRAQCTGDGAHRGGQPRDPHVLPEARRVLQGGLEQARRDHDQRREQGDREQQDVHAHHTEADGESGGGVVEHGLLSQLPVGGAFPQVVVDDEPHGHRQDRKDGDQN